MKMACWHRLIFPIIGNFLLASSHAVELELAQSHDQLIFLNSGEWKTGEVLGEMALILDVPGKQRPPVRRPTEFALLKSENPIGEFAVKAATLMPDEVKNRDICLIFGYQDQTHFYYAHISSNSDNKYHNIIMRVDGERRARINREENPEPRLSKGWKTIRVVHSGGGSIQVFVDDMEQPLMTAQDKTYPVGKIGFGAFDDRAAFLTLKY